jgi:pyridoxine kinase
VLVTSLLTQEDGDPEESGERDHIDTLVVGEDGAWLARTPLIPLDPPRNGTGDAIAALFFGNLLHSRDVPASLSLAVSSLYGLLERTHLAGTREIQLVAAQDEFVRPTHTFEARRVR